MILAIGIILLLLFSVPFLIQPQLLSVTQRNETVCYSHKVLSAVPLLQDYFKRRQSICIINGLFAAVGSSTDIFLRPLMKYMNKCFSSKQFQPCVCVCVRQTKDYCFLKQGKNKQKQSHDDDRKELSPISYLASN